MPLAMQNGKLRWKGRARGVHIKGVPNRTEAAYDAYLKVREKAGLIAAYWYEPMTLKLAHDTRLTVDFLVLENDMTLTCVDTKGCLVTKSKKTGARREKARVEEDARIKLAFAAKLYPFRFVTAFQSRETGQWVETEVKAA
jgi:hypothetical protein